MWMFNQAIKIGAGMHHSWCREQSRVRMSTTNFKITCVVTWRLLWARTVSTQIPQAPLYWNAVKFFSDMMNFFRFLYLSLLIPKYFRSRLPIPRNNALQPLRRKTVEANCGVQTGITWAKRAQQEIPRTECTQPLLPSQIANCRHELISAYLFTFLNKLQRLQGRGRSSKKATTRVPTHN